MLLDWGYPHVLGTWRFHMTLTRRLSPAERAVVQPAATAHFAAALARPPRHRYLPVHPGRRRSPVHSCRACSAARLSTATSCRAPSSTVPVFAIVSRSTGSGSTIERASRRARSSASSRPRATRRLARSVRRRRHLHHMHAEALGQLRDGGAGHVGHHHAPGLQVGGDAAGQRVAQAVGAPLQRQVARRGPPVEFLVGDALVLLAALDHRARHHPADEAEPAVALQRRVGGIDQRVLARARGTHHQHQHPVDHPVLPGATLALGCAGRNGARRHVHHPTRDRRHVRRGRQHPLAGQRVGQAVLERGGNAFDAAAAPPSRCRSRSRT